MNVCFKVIPLFILLLSLDNTVKSDSDNDDDEWTIKFETATDMYSGTNADIFVIFHGTISNSGKIKIKTKKDDLEAGKIDIYQIEVDDSIGKLKYLTIGIENFLKPFSDWIIKRIDIQDPNKTKYSIKDKFKLTRSHPIRKLPVSQDSNTPDETKIEDNDTSILFVLIVILIVIFLISVPTYLIWYCIKRLRLSSILNDEELSEQDLQSRDNRRVGVLVRSAIRNSFKRFNTRQQNNNLDENRVLNVEASAPVQLNRTDTIKSDGPPNYNELFPSNFK